MTFTEFVAIAHKGKEEAKQSSWLYNLHRSISVRLSWFAHLIFPRFNPSILTVTNIAVVALAPWAFLWLITNASSLNTATLLFGAFMFGFYLTLILDKMDGELARVGNKTSILGESLDLFYHFIYPLSFYAVVLAFFKEIYVVPSIFSVLAVAVAVLTLYFKNLKFLKTFLLSKGFSVVPLESKRPNILFRLGFYLTFMIYDLTPAFYIVTAVLCQINYNFTYLYLAHLVITILTLKWQIFVKFPRSFSRS